jgi:hypothetical protein
MFVYRSGQNEPIRNKSPEAAMIGNGSGRNEQSLQRTFHRCFLPSWKHLWKILCKECSFRPNPLPIMAATGDLFLIGWFFKFFSSETAWPNEPKLVRNWPIRNKNCLWQPYLLMDRDEMSNLYRGPSTDASYQVSDHLAKQFQRRRVLKISQSETRIACLYLFNWIE